MPAPRSTKKAKPAKPDKRAHPPKPKIHALGDAALLAELGTRLDTSLNTQAIALAHALRKRRDVRATVAAYASVTVQFDPDQTTHIELGKAITRLAARRLTVPEPGRLHRIPVVYDGPDMEEVAAKLKLSPEQVAEIHTRPIYRVFLVGFVPGWGYLGPLPEELELPRRHVPRTAVPAGSVAIAGRQTGIYPLPTPGGWHLIGRTSMKLFLPDRDPPTPFRAGDRVKFFAVRG